MMQPDEQLGGAHATARLNDRYDSIMAGASPEHSLLAFGLTLREDVPLAQAQRIVWDAPAGPWSADRVAAHIAQAVAQRLGASLQ